jgi:hypothetical protein
MTDSNSGTGIHIEGQQLENQELLNGAHDQTVVNHTGFEGLRVSGTKLNGLLAGHTKIKTFVMGRTQIKNMIIGPYTRINLGHIHKTRIDGASSVITSAIRNSIIANSIFDNILFARSMFKGIAFINVMFHRCRFSSTVFRSSTFSGCTFNKCRFVHYSTKSPFMNCGFFPLTPLGVLERCAHQFPEYNVPVKPSKFICCSGAVLLEGCHGQEFGLINWEHEALKMEEMLGLSASEEDDNIDIDNDIIGTFGVLSYTPIKDKYKQETHTNRAYRFFTNGV